MTEVETPARGEDRGPRPSDQALGYTFQQPRWLAQALAHRSYTYDHPQAASGGDNERLEFLGDAVIQLAVSQLLFVRFPRSREGELSWLRSQLVAQESLARLSRETGLQQLVRLGKAAEGSGARQQDRTLASTFEAVVGAIFMDGGWEPAARAVQSLLAPCLDRPPSPADANPKGALQELLARQGRAGPRYRLVRVEGEPHRRTFTAEVLVDGTVLGSGTGSTRKKAEEGAARTALARLSGLANGASGQKESGEPSPYLMNQEPSTGAEHPSTPLVTKRHRRRARH